MATDARERGMSAADTGASEEVPVFVLATTIVRRWRLLMSLAAAGALIGIVTASLRPLRYASQVTFVPQGADSPRSGLAGLAGQFGVQLPMGNQSQSPEFYSELVKSRELLLRVAKDTIDAGQPAARRAVMDVLGITGTPIQREDVAVKQLNALIATSISKTTSVVAVRVSTQWPEVSFAIARSVIAGVNEFNTRVRQTQASAERRFAESRAAIVGDDLRVAEDRLEAFLNANKVLTAPQLITRRDHLQRSVDLQQQLLTSLTQSMEDARLREVRDMPVISVVDTPNMPVSPEARGRLRWGMLGMLVGGMAALMWAFAAEALARRRREGDPAVEEFLAALRGAKDQVVGMLRKGRPAAP